MPENTTVLCVNCFRDFPISEGRDLTCPYCGYNNRIPQAQGSLSPKTMLKERYMLGRVKFANSEGISYTALDTKRGKRVEIREFFPTQISYREKSKIYPHDGKEESFRRYSREFAEMARSVAKISALPSIVPLTDAFKDNNTSYLVFEHFNSVSLSSYIKKKGPMTWAQVTELFIPAMSDLGAMYANGAKHLGISPETLIVCSDGRLRLSRFSMPEIRNMSGALHPDLVPGCAAFEQYSRVYESSETTDVYGFAASIIFALTGSLPENAIERNKTHKLLIPRNVLSALPKNVIKALSNALQVRQESRTGSFERFRVELISNTRVLSDLSETDAITRLPATRQYTPQKRRGLPVRLWLFLSFFIALGVLGGASLYVINHTDYFDQAYRKTIDVVEGNNIKPVESVSVPQMVGDKYSDWLSLVTQDPSYEFSITISEELFSSDYPAGYIISQSPAGDSRVEKGGTVYLIVSRGATTRTLPKISGKKYSKAAASLEELGLNPQKVEEKSATIKEGIVLGYSDYEVGDTVEFGTTVKVRVSSGSN